MFPILVAAVTALLLYSIWRRYRAFQVLWDAGHVGPRSNIISGSYFDMSRHGSHILFDKWFKEFDTDTFAFYYGSQPYVISKDLDLAKQILIKDFQKFRNRAQNTRLEASHPVIGSSLIFSSDERWKRIRNFITPSFSTVNMREMYARSSQCLNLFMDNVEAALGDSIDIYPLLRRLTLDNISRTAFGISTNVQKDVFGPTPKYQLAAERAIDRWGSLWLSAVAQTFGPVGRFLFLRLREMGLVEHPQDAMIRYIEQFVDLRGSAPKGDGQWIDFMQNIINGGGGGTMDSRRFHKSLGFKLTRNEVLGNCLLFILAAFETTSSALSFLIYHLSQEPEIQQRLRRDLKKSLDEYGDKLEYDLVMNHPYLDMIVNEGLRLFPTGNGVLGREAIEDYQYKGIRIPAGVDIVFPAYDIHRDPRNYKDPEKFDPERFSPAQKGHIPSMAFLPFGEGQRSCVGNRFALMQMKLVVAQLVLKYDVSLDAGKHQKPIKVIDRAFVLLQPGDNIHIRLSPV